jgi:hypothetical protein
MTELAALYYPFSRCVNPASLKQLLLIFDHVSFVDPVDDDQWRTKLFRDLESHDEQFSKYRGIHSALPDLLDHGCVKRVNPASFAQKTAGLATLSALSDLRDNKWSGMASNPRKFCMPSIEIKGNASWQVFLPKLPQSIRGQFISDIETRLGQLRTVPNAQEWVVAGRQVLASLRTDLQKYQAEFTANRDRVWPGIASSLNTALVSGSAVAVAMSFIGGPGKALLGSIAGASVGALKTGLDWRAESRKLQNSSSPSVAYLSRVAQNAK